MNVLLIQCDGKMPNLALMRIAAHHREKGDFVYLQQIRSERHDFALGLFDKWDAVYGSLIFVKSQPIARKILEVYPQAVIGGTGWNFRTLEDSGIDTQAMAYDLYPSFGSSIGFSQRGCRLKCGFCVVPKKEGAVHDSATINEIWRGEPWPREIILLDNDFFGSPTWREKIEEMKAGKFKVSFSQGINARMLSDEAAAALASIDYRNDAMTRKCIHTAWDNIGDEKPLFRGLNALKSHGVRPAHITAYVLVGYEQAEIVEGDIERVRKLREFGAMAYPMPYTRSPELVGFQRWVLTHYEKKIPWQRWKEARYHSYNLKWPA